MRRVILIDSHAVIHRAFHALPPLNSPDGAPTNAVYGFASILLKILRELKPDYAVAAFDREGETFRHLAFERYKAHRQKAPDELYKQIPLVKDLLGAFGIPVLELEGYEADDIIGTIAALIRRRHPRAEVIIVTGDLDALQLVDERIRVFTMRKGVSDTVLYDIAAVNERYGLRPKQLVDFKGLRGDPSDNIPGVKGIGEKTAADLLKTGGSVEGVYKALKSGELKVRPAVEAALKSHEADALFSKSLAAIDCHAPIDFDVARAKLRTSPETDAKVRDVFQHFGFYSLLRRLKEPEAGSSVHGSSLAAADAASRRLVAAKSFREVKVKGPCLVMKNPESESLLVASDGLVYDLPLSGETANRFKAWIARREKIYIFDGKLLMGLGLALDREKMFDLLLGWWLAEPGRKSYAPEVIAAKELKLPGLDQPAEIAAALLESAEKLEKKLADEKLRDVYESIEAPLAPILYAMEKKGIKLNIKPLLALSKKIKGELASLEGKIYEAAGQTFNINSPRKLAEILFDKLGLLPKGIRKTEKSGVLSTRETELLKLKRFHPIIDDILRWREAVKIKSTYVDTLPKLVREDGRVHSTWNQTGTATGRLSSQNPNLQNIPVKGKYGGEIRKAFVAETGSRLAAFDYSQLELRIASELAGDELMIESFAKGLDIHVKTAAEINGVALGEVTPEMRRKAKTLNFGILYGMGSRALAEAADISRDQAVVFIEEYFKKFTGIARFVEATKDFVRTHGYVQTVFGRKRFFPDASSTNFRIQREIERQAVNHPVQGTGADIMKKAMISIHDFIQENNLAGKVSLLVQVHDELIIEVDNAVEEDVLKNLSLLMEGAWRGRVRMKVEYTCGSSWAELG